MPGPPDRGTERSPRGRHRKGLRARGWRPVWENARAQEEIPSHGPSPGATRGHQTGAPSSTGDVGTTGSPIQREETVFLPDCAPSALRGKRRPSARRKPGLEQEALGIRGRASSPGGAKPHEGPSEPLLALSHQGDRPPPAALNARICGLLHRVLPARAPSVTRAPSFLWRCSRWRRQLPQPRSHPLHFGSGRGHRGPST